MFKVQCFRWQAIKVQCFCVQRNMDAFATPAPAQDYVQGALLQMTGDQGAVLFVCRGTWTLLSPPRPCPGLCSRCSASDDRRSRCSAFVCRGTWTLLSPPAPAQDYVQGAVLQMTGDQGAVLFVCRGTWTLLSPPPPLPRTMFKVQCFRWQAIKVQCFAFVCRGTWTLLSPPHTPNQTLNGWVKWWFKSMDPTLVPSINDAFVPLHPPNQTLNGWFPASMCADDRSCARMTRFLRARMTRLQCAQMTRFQCAQMTRLPEGSAGMGAWYEYPRCRISMRIHYTI